MRACKVLKNSIVQLPVIKKLSKLIPLKNDYAASSGLIVGLLPRKSFVGKM